MSSTEQYTVLGEKPVGALLLQYALPAIIAMMASSLYNIVDGIFIGQGVGADAITGLALTNPLMAISAAFGAMVGVGGATLMSVRLGQQDYESARKILGNVVLLNSLCGLLFQVGVYLFLDPILRSFGASDATLPYAREFMHIILLGNVFTHLFYGLNAQLRSTNRPRLAMYSTFGSVFINAAFCALFIFGFGWGISGAALATVLAQVSMLCWQIYLFSNKKDPIHLSLDILRPHWRIMRESILIGLPQFLVNSCTALVGIIITRSMAEYGGDTAVGAYGIIARLLTLIVFIVIGLNQGMQPIAGYNYGAQKYDRLLEVLKKAIIFATCITTTGCLACFIFATPLATLFAKDSPALIQQAAHTLRIMVATFPLVGIQIMSVAFFQSIGFSGKSIFLALTRQLIFLIPLILILPHIFSNPVNGVLFSLPAADTLAFLIAITLQAQQVRKLKKLIK